ncbi:hypothetical protein TNCV_2138501 [Trichonephila clavipes]|nr:hypothetical protein TNCV_2138501 [Trichonephila clavipes]
MDSVSRCWTRIIASLDSRRPGSIIVCSTRIGLERPRADCCGLPMMRDEGHCVSPLLVFKSCDVNSKISVHDVTERTVRQRNEKVRNHGSIPIPIDCNVVAFIVFEEGFHQPIKRTKQSVFLDVTVFRHTLVD